MKHRATRSKGKAGSSNEKVGKLAPFPLALSLVFQLFNVGH